MIRLPILRSLFSSLTARLTLMMRHSLYVTSIHKILDLPLLVTQIQTSLCMLAVLVLLYLYTGRPEREPDSHEKARQDSAHSQYPPGMQIDLVLRARAQRSESDVIMQASAEERKAERQRGLCLWNAPYLIMARILGHP